MGNKYEAGVPQEQEKSIPKVRYNREHLEAHKQDFLLSIEELHSRVKLYLSEISIGQRTGELKTVLFPEEKIGQTGCVDNPDPEKIFWGNRSNRKTPSRLVADTEKQSTNGLTIIGKWAKPDVFELHTMYPGKPAPQEVVDKNLTKEDADSAFEYWRNHALIAGDADKPHPKSKEIEAAFQNGDLNLIRRLIAENTI